jgi:hypothetical protein
MIVIAGIARRLFEDAARQMLYQPEIAAGVVAFDLMSRRSAAPEKFVRESLAPVVNTRDSHHLRLGTWLRLGEGRRAHDSSNSSSGDTLQ